MTNSLFKRGMPGAMLNFQRLLRLALITIAMGTLSSYSHSSPFLVDHSITHRLSTEVEYLLDPSSTLNLEQVKTSDNWSHITSSNINFSFRPDALWLRFSLTVKQPDDYILHIPYPLIDYLDNYSFVNGVPLPPIKTGDARAFESRVEKYIDFVFPYYLQQNDVLTVYLRASTSGSLDIPIDITSKKIFTEAERANNFFRGFVSGILWLMLFYNFFIFAAIKDRVYLFYVIHIFACMVTSYAYDGSAFQYLWPNTPELNSKVFPIFNGLIQATSIIFMLELLQVLKTQTWYRTYFLGLLSIVSFFPILGAILPYSKIVPVEVLFSLLVNGSAMILGISLSIKGNRSAQYFTVAISLFMVGLVSSNLKSLGLMPNNFFTQHVYQIGFFIEMVVLSLALAQRIDAAKKELIQAQNDNIINLNRYKKLYSESVSGNFQINKTGKVMSVNNAFCRILGFDSIQALMSSDISKNISDISVDHSVPNKLMKIMKKKGELVDFEDQVKDKSGKCKWVSLSMRPVLSHDDQIEYFEGSMIDISERKDNEYLRDQAIKDKMNTLEQLIVGICHELNTPLGSSITGLSHIKDLIHNLAHSFEDKKLTQAIFKDILTDEIDSLQFTEKNLIRIRDLIKQFKHISVNQLDYQTFNARLYETIENGLELSNALLKEKKVTTTIDCAETLQLTSYNQAISEVIHQLVSNSLDHGFSKDTNHSIYISAGIQDNTVFIEYQDNGTGLSNRGQKELFNPFYTTMRGSQGKIGLGMYLTYNIITQLLNGKIEMLDAEVGMKLKLSFPVAINT